MGSLRTEARNVKGNEMTHKTYITIMGCCLLYCNIENRKTAPTEIRAAQGGKTYNPVCSITSAVDNKKENT